MKTTQQTYVLIDVKTGSFMQHSRLNRMELHWTTDLNLAQTFTDRRQVVNFLNIHPKKLLGVGEVTITRRLKK